MGSYQRTLARSKLRPMLRNLLSQVIHDRVLVRRALWDFVQPENEDAFDVPTRRERGVDCRRGVWRIRE